MKFNANQKEFKAAVKSAFLAVPKRGRLPILENVLIETGSDECSPLRILATDLEIFLSLSVKSDGPKVAGATTVSARGLLSALDGMSGEVSCEVKEGNLVVTDSSGFEVALAVLEADGFPAFPEAPPVLAEIPGEAWRAAVDAVAYCASPPRDDMPILSSILLDPIPAGAQLVALDGYRMGIASVPGIRYAGKKEQVTIPARALDLFGKILPKKYEDPITVSSGEAFIGIHSSGMTLLARKCEGEFPHYERVVPDGCGVALTVNRATFLDALKRVSAFAQERESPRLVKISYESGAIVVRAETADFGRAKKTVEVETCAWGSGWEDPEIGFNARYLMDALDAIPTERATLRISRATNPGELVPEGDDAADVRYVIMPVRTLAELEKQRRAA